MDARVRALLDNQAAIRGSVGGVGGFDFILPLP